MILELRSQSTDEQALTRLGQVRLAGASLGRASLLASGPWSAKAAYRVSSETTFGGGAGFFVKPARRMHAAPQLPICDRSPKNQEWSP